MAVFSYKARNASGTSVSGVLEAFSEEDLMGKLQAMNYTPTVIRPGQEKVEKEPAGIGLLSRIKSRDIVLLNLRLAYMTDAGIPLLNSIRILAGQFEDPVFKNILLSVSQKVFEGSSLSDAMADHPQVFSEMYVNMVKVGEVSGTLHTVLNRMAIYIEAEENLRQKIQGALFYPMVLLCAGCLVLILIVTFVIPQFVTIFTKAHVQLPLPTLILYHFGLFVKQFWFLIIPSVFAAGFLFKAILATPGGKDHFDRFIFRIPYIGLLMKEVFITRFCRGLGILLESDVPILRSLDVVKDVIGNNIYKRIIVQVGHSVQKGEKISHQLNGSAYFPNDVVSMIATGEETGKLAPMLYKVAGFYEMIVDNSVKKLTMLIEPVFIVLIGLMAGFIMASMLLPLFDMVKTIQN